MNKNQRLSGIYLPLLLISIVVPTVLRSIAVLRDLDYATGYFSGGKVFSTAAGISVTALSLLLLTYAVAAKGETHLRASFATPATYIPVGAIGAALIFFAADAFARIKSYGVPIRFLIASKNITATLYVLLTLLAILACVYFITNAMILEKASVSRASFGICAVLFFALYAAFLYFNTDLPLNAPNKIIDQMAYLAAAIFFLYEIRISLGRECWNLYIAFGFITSTLTAFSAIPSIIVYFTKEAVISNSIFETALTLSMFIFVTSRTALALQLDDDKESELVTLIKEASGNRASVLAEKHAIEKRAYLEVINRFNEVEEIHDEPSEAVLFPSSTATVEETSADAESAPEAAAEASADAEPEAVAETSANAEPAPEAATEASADAEPEAVAEASADAEPEAVAETSADAEPEAVAETSADAESAPEDTEKEPPKKKKTVRKTASTARKSTKNITKEKSDE